MTHEELDAMWSIATRKSIEDNQPYTRYEFAKMVAAKEREACIELIKSHGPTLANGFMLTEAIRTRGEA